MNTPKELQHTLEDPGVKKIWFCNFSEQTPNACQNCGGTHIVAAFAAYEGPFDTPPGPYAMRMGNDGKRHYLSSRIEIIDGKTKYWAGNLYSVACPDCQGQPPPNLTAPAHAPVWSKKLADKMEKQYEA